MLAVLKALPVLKSVTNFFQKLKNIYLLHFHLKKWFMVLLILEVSFKIFVIHYYIKTHL